jgi:2C-methyl-D-erythritol 2,4-cyclodiphosphate synthase
MKDVNVSDEEINVAVNKKLVTVELKWLFAPNKDSLLFFTQGISSGIPFDSLFRLQLTDSVFEDQRKWNTDLFNLEQKSNMIAGLIKNQKVGSVSSPVKGPDGWYIFNIVNIWREALPNESELNQLKEKSQEVLQKAKMDSLSDKYVRKIFVDQNPQIIGKTFDLLRTYLAKYEVNPDKSKNWKLDDNLNFLQQQIDSLKKDFYSLTLVEMKDGPYSFKDFIDWLRYREQNVKFKETDFDSFSGSVESYVWRMVRDNSLTKIAFSKGYQNIKSVREQLDWWKDKIVYAVVRDELIGSALLGNTQESFKFENKPLSDEANKKLLHKVLALKQKYKIKINKDILSEIKVGNENDPKTIDVFVVKKGGVFPRPAFPSIDILWQNWQ